MKIENIKKLYNLNRKRENIIKKLDTLKRCKKHLGYDTKILFESSVKLFFQSEFAGLQSDSISNQPNDYNDKYHEIETACLKEVFNTVEKFLNKELYMIEKDIKEL